MRLRSRRRDDYWSGTKTDEHLAASLTQDTERLSLENAGA